MAWSKDSFTWVVVALAGTACGGTAFTGSPTDGGSASEGGEDGGASDGSSDGAPNDGSSDGASDGGTSSRCPAASRPTVACTQEGLQCEYGNDLNAACNLVFECQSGQFRAITVSTQQPKTCPTPTPANENKCPATRNLVPTGTACSDDSLECAYAKDICACTGNGLGGPVGTPKWVCPTPAAGCPAVRPHLGSDCATEGQQCNYGECAYAGGVNLSCTNGAWKHVATPCPL